MWELQQEEDLWESATASSVAELCEKKRRLKEIRASIEDIGAQIEGKKIVSSSKQCDEKNEQQREISDWYDERVRYWPQGTPTPGREDDVDAAREAFKDHQPPVIDLRGKVLSARRRLAPEHWRRDGPKGHKKAQRKAELKP